MPIFQLPELIRRWSLELEFKGNDLQPARSVNKITLDSSEQDCGKEIETS